MEHHEPQSNIMNSYSTQNYRLLLVESSSFPKATPWVFVNEGSLWSSNGSFAAPETCQQSRLLGSTMGPRSIVILLILGIEVSRLVATIIHLYTFWLYLIYILIFSLEWLETLKVYLYCSISYRNRIISYNSNVCLPKVCSVSKTCQYLVAKFQ